MTPCSVYSKPCLYLSLCLFFVSIIIEISVVYSVIGDKVIVHPNKKNTRFFFYTTAVRHENFACFLCLMKWNKKLAIQFAISTSNQCDANCETRFSFGCVQILGKRNHISSSHVCECECECVCLILIHISLFPLQTTIERLWSALNYI